MNNIQKIQELVKQLNQYRDEYYNQNNPSVSNQEYDKLFDQLLSLEKESGYILANSPTQQVGYEVVSKLQKVNHKTPLLSLDKTKSIDDLNQWKKDQYTILMLKADGLTIELEYNNHQLISASTRGNGEIGELITFNALTFQNIPKTISFDGYLRLSGEAVIHWNDFNEINAKLPEDQRYKTPRNLVSGSCRQLDSKICAERKVYFYAFEILECSDKSQLQDLKYQNFKWLDKLGFDTISRIWLTPADKISNSHIEDLKNWAKDLELPIDGLVLSFDSISYSNSLGKTQHHPLYSLAYKFSDETEETILKKVEWNTTRSGQINPTAVFDTVELDGTEVSRASLFNLNFIRDMGLHIGCRIKVSKRNMIIPYIEENIDQIKGDNIKLQIPDKCPSCGQPTYIQNTGTADFLFCKNPNCPAQLLDKFVHFVSREGMNIEGLSEQTLEKFINKGFVKTFSDIYKLAQYRSEIISMEGFGVRSYNKLIEAIEKSKNVKMENFIFSLGIEQVGKGGSRRLAEYFKNNINKFLDVADSYFELIKIKDFGDITSQSVSNYFQDEDNMMEIDRLLMYIKITKPEEKKSSNLKDLTGISFVVTGEVTTFKNRKELEDLIISLNGKLNSGVSSKTNYLINNDVNSNSSKNQKAKELGVPIISELEFNKMIGR